MNHRISKIIGKFVIALLTTGSAIALFSCSGRSAAEGERDERMMTQQADTLTIIQTKNGLLKYRFETPLMEGYSFASEPYREFRRGIYIETYQDSTQNIESTLIADYAINYINRELWEAKGNVVGTNAQGHILETQQLFWNQKIGKIYSYVDTRVTQGSDVLVGVGFESDEAFEVWEFQQPRGKLLVDFEPTRDSTAGPAGESPAMQDAARESGGGQPVAEDPQADPMNMRNTQWQPPQGTGEQQYTGRAPAEDSPPSPEGRQLQNQSRTQPVTNRVPDSRPPESASRERTPLDNRRPVTVPKPVGQQEQFPSGQ